MYDNYEVLKFVLLAGFFSLVIGFLFGELLGFNRASNAYAEAEKRRHLEMEQKKMWDQYLKAVGGKNGI